MMYMCLFTFMVVKIKTGKIYGLQPPLVATVAFFFVLFFFFLFHGRLSKAILKNCLFAITYSGVQGMDRQVGIFFFLCVRGVGMKTRIFKLGTSLEQVLISIDYATVISNTHTHMS